MGAVQPTNSGLSVLLSARTAPDESHVLSSRNTPAGALSGDAAPPAERPASVQSTGTPVLAAPATNSGAVAESALTHICQTFAADGLSATAILYVFFEIALMQRTEARLARAAARDVAVATLVKKADDIRDEAMMAFAGAMVSASLTMASGMVQLRAAWKSGSAASESQATAIQQGATARGKLLEALGQLSSAGTQLRASDYRARQTLDDADHETAQAAADDANDYARAYDEAVTKTVQLLQQILQSRAESDRAIARSA